MVANLGGAGRNTVSAIDAGNRALAQRWSRTGLRFPSASRPGSHAFPDRASRFSRTLREWLSLHRLFRAWRDLRYEPGQDWRVVCLSSPRVWLALSFAGIMGL